MTGTSLIPPAVFTAGIITGIIGISLMFWSAGKRLEILGVLSGTGLMAIGFVVAFQTDFIAGVIDPKTTDIFLRCRIIDEHISQSKNMACSELFYSLKTRK